MKKKRRLIYMGSRFKPHYYYRERKARHNISMYRHNCSKRKHKMKFCTYITIFRAPSSAAGLTQKLSIIDANDGLYDFLGYTREEFLEMGNCMASILHPDDMKKNY